MHGHKIISKWPQGTTDFIRSCISVDMTYCSQRELGLIEEKAIKESYKINSELFTPLSEENLRSRNNSHLP